MKKLSNFFATKIIKKLKTKAFRKLNINYVPNVCAYSNEKATKIYSKAFQKAFEFIVMNNIKGDIAEFGSMEGFTASILAKSMQNNNYLSNIHLFDSFIGLPEITSNVDLNSYEVKSDKVWKKGSMSVASNIPFLIKSHLQKILPKDNIYIHNGFFKDTFKPKVLNNKLSIVHIDCDLYQSAKEVLSKLFKFNLIQDGMIMLFDDFNCGHANPNFGERRALREIMEENKKYSYSIFYYYGWHGAAIILHDLTFNKK